MSLTLAQLGRYKLREVHEAVGVTPLVVIPGHNLDLVADHLGQAGVEDGRCRVADDVGGDDRLVGVGQQAPELLGLRCCLEGGVDFGDRGLAGNRDGQVRGGAGGNGHADGVAVELALELRQDQADCLGGTGGGGHHVDGGGAGGGGHCGGGGGGGAGGVLGGAFRGFWGGGGGGGGGNGPALEPEAFFD